VHSDYKINFLAALLAVSWPSTLLHPILAGDRDRPAFRIIRMLDAWLVPVKIHQNDMFVRIVIDVDVALLRSVKYPLG